MKPLEYFKAVFGLFFAPGEVTEIRIIGANGKNKAWQGWSRDIVYGYFNDPDQFAIAAEKASRVSVTGIYFTPNPTNPALLARTNNTLVASSKKAMTTSDKDISLIRWLLIDIDPTRPAGISSTEGEIALAIAKRDEIIKYLTKEDIAGDSIIRAMSGNGAHALVRIPDLPNNEENIDLVRSTLAHLADKFDDDKVTVDKKVYNPARIWKLYGTLARKGANTNERPHRRSLINKEDLK